MNIENVIVELIEAEERYSNELIELSNTILHPTLSAIFKAVALDSKKHAEIYRAVLKLIKELQPLISEDDLRIIKETIDKHIKTEVLMIEKSKDVLGKIDDPRVKILVEAIHQNEIEHHKILSNIKDKLASQIIAVEKDIWEAIWLYSPWHGTPGG
uniref:Ferritin-like domain-containing protein n=1 Tax=Ignisphaera aggregans TaxID=334771 RepID=A0A7C5UWF7_9CREN